MVKTISISQREEVLARIRPALLVGDDSRQQRKSVDMRTRLLEAVIDCLVEKGYAGMSANDAARRAGASRGALHHHFATRMQLIATVVEYTFYRRMEFFLDHYARRTQPDDPELAIRSTAILFWKTLRTREYAAFIELALASRTDPELKSHFAEASQRFDRVWNKEMSNLFPHWKGQLRLATDFALSAYTGLILQQGVLGNSRRSATVRALITHVLTRLHPNALPMISPRPDIDGPAPSPPLSAVPLEKASIAALP